MSKLRSFEDLECWKSGRELRNFIRKKIITQLPIIEKYRLTDQIIRSSRSITANIAEGYGRFHYLDNAKFCSIARGSSWELLDHLITAFDEEYIGKELLKEASIKIHFTIRLLNGYIKYLQMAHNKKSKS